MAIKTIKEESLTALGDAIREKTNTEDLLEFPSGMVEAIESIPDPVEMPEEAFVITGNCNYRFANNGWNWFIEQFGDQLTTKDISNGAYMFNGASQLERIPFDINLKTGTQVSITHLFENAQGLKEVPKITGKISYVEKMFYQCYNLREISEDSFAGIDWSYIDTQTSAYGGSSSGIFQNCHSLRKYPNSLLVHANPVSAYSYSIYNYNFSYCYALDEIVGLPIPHQRANWTSNAFTSFCYYTTRLKKLTFQTNDDGSPIIIPQWSNQTIDLSVNVGWASSYSGSLMNWNSGITKDKEVKDDATYQALKNDPDWFATKVEYSRYNHDSAVETINSLPDVSAKTKNTIKFKGPSGSLTDGGAINTLTEEEIAVATAKGWTVTFVS